MDLVNTYVISNISLYAQGTQNIIYVITLNNYIVIPNYIYNLLIFKLYMI